MTRYRSRKVPHEKVQARVSEENARYLADYASAGRKSTSLALDEIIAFHRRRCLAVRTGEKLEKTGVNG